jgi:hypothetical protein
MLSAGVLPKFTPVITTSLFEGANIGFTDVMDGIGGATKVKPGKEVLPVDV